ncbi:hypothetical protein [Thalassoglobus polymorphus]|uniref:Neutral/alkaline non-lysosomal ceramidase n=1 Tax=Thalassoglobus polymorphus TaxID=2527994 RepID=A0A517QPY8_9PLAN|nr:hypothetical protein [Thalassoglobus polymorphus]QDT33643.1 hypothetical protein Mal48_28970 [Thalassoglobus polymorphus]
MVGKLVPKALCAFSLFVITCSQVQAEDSVRVASFNVDASTPVGSPLAYDSTIGVQLPLSCRGVVILSDQKPIVLCALDWIGISNGGQTVFRESLAKAAKTDVSRVVVHSLHQHDAPRCDFSADELLADEGLENAGFDARHARSVVVAASKAVQEAIEKAVSITHIGQGAGVVEKVASNRRILGEDGKVKYTRFTATRDPKIRAFPAGTIDPVLKSISFWNGETPVAVLTYYATHPQSYYRTGLANPDFPGMARNSREKSLDIPHIHFNGAGGNIGAGKWNDGSKENRQVLADRVAAGMKKAWESTTKQPVSADDIHWKTTNVLLPVAGHLNEEDLVKAYKNSEAKPAERYAAAKHLIWLKRCQEKDPIQISCLKIGDINVLHMPGELFVEYQLASQKMVPDEFVAMAAYGEYAPGYIGTEIAYTQGGYEASARASRVAPGVEKVLMDAMKELLKD